jgi:hypothetical protein
MSVLASFTRSSCLKLISIQQRQVSIAVLRPRNFELAAALPWCMLFIIYYLCEYFKSGAALLAKFAGSFVLFSTGHTFWFVFNCDRLWHSATKQFEHH